MATAVRIPLETYLHSSYEPDVEYLDGELEERNRGEFDHNMIQRAILFWFYQREKEWSIRAIQEQRTLVAPNQVRLPDVSIFSRDIPVEQVFTRPQIVAVEVLSPEDRHDRVAERVLDYMRFGIRNIWIIDSKTREGWDCSRGDWVRTERFEVPGAPIYISLPELFAQIDRDNS